MTATAATMGKDEVIEEEVTDGPGCSLGNAASVFREMGSH